MTVLGHLHIKLRKIHAHSECFPKRDEGVFRHIDTATTVTHHTRFFLCSVSTLQRFQKSLQSGGKNMMSVVVEMQAVDGVTFLVLWNVGVNTKLFVQV